MDRADFFHVLSAAADAIQETEFVVLGSQAIVGYYLDPPAAMVRSMEVDLYPRDAPDRAIEIDGAVGEGSPFQGQFGYYAHSVGPETATAPQGWEDRLVPVRIPPRAAGRPVVTAWCIEAHDLVLAKLARGDQRDWDFAKAALAARIAQADRLLALVPTMGLPESQRHRITEAVEGIAKATRDGD